MRIFFILLLTSVITGACSSTKIVPASTPGIAPPPPPSSMPPAVAEQYKRLDYNDSSDRGTLSIQPTGSNILVLEHITVTGQLPQAQSQPTLRIIIMRQDGERLEHPLTISEKENRYIYDSDVMHRLLQGEQAIVEVFDPTTGDLYPARIKASGYQETK